MKVSLFIVYVILLWGCSSDRNEVDFTTIKVFTTYSADTVTAYNKDMGVADYLFYDSKTDSLIYRDLTDIDPNQYKTYVGRFNNKRYTDTLLNLVRALRKYNNGIIPVEIDTTATYCGPEYYVEYQDDKGEHHNLFILDGNDTLEQFSGFFSRLKRLPWKKTQVRNSIIKSDSEVVTAMRKVGLYEKQETPYVPLPCDSVIDKTKIYGAWRTVGNRYNRSIHSYSKVTFKQDGFYLFEEIKEGRSTGVKSGRFLLNAKDNTFIIKASKEYKYKVLKLTETCFEYFKEGDSEDVMRFDRL